MKTIHKNRTPSIEDEQQKAKLILILILIYVDNEETNT